MNKRNSIIPPAWLGKSIRRSTVRAVKLLETVKDAQIAAEAALAVCKQHATSTHTFLNDSETVDAFAEDSLNACEQSYDRFCRERDRAIKDREDLNHAIESAIAKLKILKKRAKEAEQALEPLYEEAGKAYFGADDAMRAAIEADNAKFAAQTEGDTENTDPDDDEDDED